MLAVTPTSNAHAQATQGVSVELQWYDETGLLSYRPDVGRVFISQDGECCLIVNCNYHCFFVLPLPREGRINRYEFYGETTTGRGPSIVVLIFDQVQPRYHEVLIVPRSKELVELFLPKVLKHDPPFLPPPSISKGD